MINIYGSSLVHAQLITYDSITLWISVRLKLISWSLYTIIIHATATIDSSSHPMQPAGFSYRLCVEFYLHIYCNYAIIGLSKFDTSKLDFHEFLKLLKNLTKCKFISFNSIR